jgi:acyl carrier protein
MADELCLKQIGLPDNFFSLGGHWLSAARVISRLWNAFGVEVPLRDIFEKPTVAEIAATIEQIRPDAFRAEECSTL